MSASQQTRNKELASQLRRRQHEYKALQAKADNHAEINKLLQWLEIVQADESRDHEMRVTYGVAARVVRNYIETRGLWPNGKVSHE